MGSVPAPEYRIPSRAVPTFAQLRLHRLPKKETSGAADRTAKREIKKKSKNVPTGHKRHCQICEVTCSSAKIFLDHVSSRSYRIQVQNRRVTSRCKPCGLIFKSCGHPQRYKNEAAHLKVVASSRFSLLEVGRTVSICSVSHVTDERWTMPYTWKVKLPGTKAHFRPPKSQSISPHSETLGVAPSDWLVYTPQYSTPMGLNSSKKQLKTGIFGLLTVSAVRYTVLPWLGLRFGYVTDVDRLVSSDCATRNNVVAV